MSWTSLKNGIATVIKTNGNQEITGNALQGVLNSMVNALGAHATFAGMAIPSISPGTPDGPVFYFALQEGSYSNFGATPFIVSEGEFGIFIWDGTIWNTFKYTLGTELSEIDALRLEIYGEETEVAVLPEYVLAGFRMTHGGVSTNSSASDQSINSYPVEAGKTYHLTIPSVKNQYVSAYCFHTAIVDTTQITATQPDPKVLGPATNASYDITIPEGFTYLIVSYVTESGSPTLTTMQSSGGGLKGKVEDLMEDMEDVQDAVEELESAITPMAGVPARVDTIEETLDGVSEPLTLELHTSREGYRISSAGDIKTSSSNTIYTYNVNAGQSYHLVVPKTPNAYSAVFSFCNSDVIGTGTMTTVPESPTLGTQGRVEVDVTIPDGFQYLWITFDNSGNAPTVTTIQKSKGLVDDVNDLKDEVDDLKNVANMGVEISLPNRYVVVVGDTLQIFRKGVIKAVNPYNYNVMFSCAMGRNYPRYWFVKATKAEEIGTYPLTVTVTDNLGNTLASAQTELVVVANPASPSTAKKFVCIGASGTAPGKWPAECYRRLTGNGGTPAGKGLTNIEFCGPMTKDGAGYFGVGGWSWASYISSGAPAFRFQVSGVGELYIGATYTNNGHTYTVREVNVTEGTGNILCATSSSSNTPTESGTLTKATGDGDTTITFSSAAPDAANPFWNNTTHKLDFQSYANLYCDGNIDCMISLLGWNGRTKYETDFTITKAQVRTFIDAFHADFPNGKFIILGIYGPSPIGGMGANYGSNQALSDWYGMQVTVLNLKLAYQEIANEDDYSDFVSFVDVAGQFDSEYNMPYSLSPKNQRMTIKEYASGSEFDAGDIIKYNGQTYRVSSAFTAGATLDYSKVLPFNPYEMLGTNGVHPSNDGYYQIADAAYRQIVNMFCQ